MRGQKAAISRAGVKTLLRRRLPQQHLGPVIRANGGARKIVPAIREHVERDVIRVRPDAHLRVIGKIGVRERVPVPRAGGVCGL